MKTLGPEHPTLAAALNNRAEMLRAQVRAIRKLQEVSVSWCPVGAAEIVSPY